MPRAFGIDVSSVQDSINWDRVSKAGLTFVVCKATSGIGHDLDSCFQRHVAGARGVGLMASLYHWWVWSRDPEEQAANVEWSAGLVGGTDFPVALDVESPEPGDWVTKGFQPEAAIKNVCDCADAVTRRLGRAPLLYTYPWFVSSLLAPRNNVSPELVARLAGFELWSASGERYLQPWTPTNTDAPPPIKPWSDWRVWQYSGGTAAKGGLPVPGILGFVDRDCFNGTVDDFKAWAGETVRTIPPETEKPAALDVVERPNA